MNVKAIIHCREVHHNNVDIVNIQKHAVHLVVLHHKWTSSIQHYKMLALDIVCYIMTAAIN